jgi:hypothetical protein
MRAIPDSSGNAVPVRQIQASDVNPYHMPGADPGRLAKSTAVHPVAHGGVEGGEAFECGIGECALIFRAN